MVVGNPAGNGQKLTVTLLSIQEQRVELGMPMKRDVALRPCEDWERSRSGTGVNQDGAALRPIAELLFATWPRSNQQPLVNLRPATPEEEEVATVD